MPADEACDCPGHRVRAEDLTVELADFMAVDGWFSNDSPHQFDARRAWVEYRRWPEMWHMRAEIMTRAEGRPWDAVDAIVASVGPWWVPEPGS